jgi:hypothetical protein
MASFTLPSKRQVPALTLRLAAVALLTWAACVAYVLWLNPEIRFMRAAAAAKQHWARQLTREQGAKYLIFGSSSCTFSIDGERLLERHQLPLVNMGLIVSYGAKTITEWSLSETQPGDTLIAALDPAMIARPDILPTSDAIQFCYALRSPQWVHGVLEPSGPDRFSSLLSLRPGGYHASILFGKMFQRGPMYRYAIEEIHPSGWVETPVRMNLGGSPGHGDGLSAQGRALLSSLGDWCRTNRVRVCYSLPMAWCPPEELEAFQRGNARFLLEVSKLLPVLEDRRLGAHTNASLFADTSWHLNAGGVALRTDELAGQLRAWKMWNPDELRTLATNGLAVPVP